MPIARAASHWPRSIDWMPARNTSAKNAADWIEKVTAPATNGVISMPTSIGRAKKNQKSWTSGGVVRNTSMMKPAGHDRKRRGESRSRASASPSATPKTSAVPVILSVFARPSTNSGALARTGEKSH